jgi:hypothetical protein
LTVVRGVSRRQILGGAVAGLASTTFGGCSESPPPERYTQADIDQLAAQQANEAQQKGKGPFGEQRYQGYRGLASLPWFELDDGGRLICVDESLPGIVDVHAHLGMSILFKPRLDLLDDTPRMEHLLDCDGMDPPCELDLDIYINGNFSPAALKQNERVLTTQGLWGNDTVRSHTIPNLLTEMDTMGVQQTFVLPIKLGLPFGDDLSEQWQAAIREAGAGDRINASFRETLHIKVGMLTEHAAHANRVADHASVFGLCRRYVYRRFSVCRLIGSDYLCCLGALHDGYIVTIVAHFYQGVCRG